ncbi:MAG TPA: glycosyltransferase family 4 protein [Chloroflexia bacterium]|nr:glycosyltransferase family 4 protein [Chloroflexia bacterium]
MGTSDQAPLGVLLITDVFPPASGGSGWSTYYLGKALAERGHKVRVLRPRYGLRVGRPVLHGNEYGGLPVEEALVPGAPRWLVKLRIGRAWEEREARRILTRRAMQLARRGSAQVFHAQHKVSAVAASTAARRMRARGYAVPAVATVRDYWPLCPVSTRLFPARGGQPAECADCHRFPAYWRCASQGWRGAIDPALDLARYLTTRRAAQSLASCDTVIAVSRYVREELVRSKRVSADRVVVVPNLVDLASVERDASGPWPLNDISPEEPFLLFAGKLEHNKGVNLLPTLVARSGANLPLVVAGDGGLEGSLRERARAQGLDFRFVSWIENESIIRLMRAARVLVFPSAWQEPLSRVLLEGCAAGAAVAALDTGGTSDILTHMESGWLARDLDDLAQGVAALAADDDLNTRVRQGARAKAEESFASDGVAAQVELIYRDAMSRAEAAR